MARGRTENAYTGSLMSHTSRSVLALGAVFFAFAIAACGDSVPSGDVAKVDNLTISKVAYDRWYKLASTSNPSSPVIDPPKFTKCIAEGKKALGEPVKGQPKPKDSDFRAQCKQQYEQIKQQVMTFLLRSTWLYAEAERQNVKVTDAEARASFDKARKAAFPKPGEYAKFIKTSGQTEADLVYRQGVQLLEQKITEKVQSKVKPVTDKDVRDFYAENKDKQFTQAATRDLRVLVTNDEKKAKQAREELDGGSSWTRVVAKYSTDQQTKQTDGNLPNVTQGTGNPDLERAVFSAKKDEITGPVKTSDGYYVFEVTKTSPKKVQAFKDVKDSIKASLAQERRQAALNKFGQDYQDRWRKESECASGYISPDCANSKTPPASTVPPGAIPQQDPAQQQQVPQLPGPGGGAQPQVPQQQQQQQAPPQQQPQQQP